MFIPSAGEWQLVLFLITLVISVPFLAYRSGFRNGKREGERIQLQKHVDNIKELLRELNANIKLNEDIVLQTNLDSAIKICDGAEIYVVD